MRFLRDKNQSGGKFFDHAAKSKPRTERNSAHYLFRDPAQIYGNQAEAATLQQNVGNFEGLFKRR